jgi:hypothetical protein
MAILFRIRHAIEFDGAPLAFGLTVVTMAYAVGHISGAHFNPAITLGLWAGGRTSTLDVIPYIQVAGAVAAAAVLKARRARPARLGGFASNGFGDLSPGHYNLLSCAIRGPSDILFPVGRYRSNLGGCAGRFCASRNRPDLDPHCSCGHSSHQRISQSCPKHGSRAICRQSLYRSALVFLGGADLGRPGGRRFEQGFISQALGPSPGGAPCSHP